jgi:predicted S18 family serine protease
MSVRLSFLQKSLLAVFAVLLMLFSAPAFAATTTVYPSDMAVDFTDVGNNPEKWFFFR